MTGRGRRRARTPPRWCGRTTGGNNGYQDQKRYKPQFYTTLSYFKDGWKGSHDLRVGFDWKRDRRSLFNDQPFDIWYRDNNGALAQVDLYNSNVTGINDVVYTSGWVNDTWKLTDRLTLNLGARFENYATVARAVADAERHPGARRLERPALYRRSSRRRRCRRQTVASTNTFSPKVGFAYDLTGDNRTVLKAFYGLSRWNSADVLADQENPVGLAQLRYAFVSCAAGQTTGCDLNGDRLVSSPAELGAFQSTQGGGGFVRVDRDLVRPMSHEVSFNLEREMRTGLSGRASYVYKNMRNVWGEIDLVRDAAYTVPFTFIDPGRDRVAGTGDDQTFNTHALRRGAGPGSRVHQHRRRCRLPQRRVRGQPPLLRQVDDADVVRLHLVDDVSRQHRRQRGAPRHHHHAPTARSTACSATTASKRRRCGTTR